MNNFYLMDMTQENKGLATILKAMGHPTRIAIFNLLHRARCNRLTVKSIYEGLNIDQPSASRHLGIMRNIGILERVQEAQNTFYCICEENPIIDCFRRCFDKPFFE